MEYSLYKTLAAKYRITMTKAKLKFTKTPGGITIQVPTQAPDKIATVVRLELKEKLPAIQLISNTAKAFEIADE